MSDYLSPDALVEILSRLRVKSLLRFISVSKSWQSLITSPNFINTHLNKSPNNNSNLLLLRYGTLNPQQEENYSLRFDDKIFAQYAEIKCPLKTRFYFRVVGTCNGLVCLSNDLYGDSRTIILWNPLIRRFVTLPSPIDTTDSSVARLELGLMSTDDWFESNPSVVASVLGFGFAPQTHDFKVVRIAFVHKRHVGVGECGAVFSKIEVYALKTGSWKTVTGKVSSSYTLPVYIWDHVFLNGAAHWIAYKRLGDGNYHNVLLSFGLDDEVFREIELPESLASTFPLNLGLKLVRNMISVKLHVDGPTVNYSTCRSVWWVMKKYGEVESWTKLYNVDLREHFTSLGIRESGELLMVNGDGDVVSYHPGIKLGEKLGMRGVSFSVHASTFVESLVLLDSSFNGHLLGGHSVGYIDEEEGEEEANETALKTTFKRLALYTGSFIAGSVLDFMNWHTSRR